MLTDYIAEVRQRYEDWWEGRSSEPLLYVIFQRDDSDYPAAVRDWMEPRTVERWTGWRHEFVFGQAVQLSAETGDLTYVDDAIDLFARHADATDRIAEGYHFLFINLGASMMSAFLTGVTDFRGDTIWLELPEPLTLDEILELDASDEPRYTQVAFEAIRRLVDRLGGRFVFAPPELGGILDILAALRTTTNLLLDTMDQPEKLDACFEHVFDLWKHYRRRLWDIIEPHNRRCWAQAMRLLAGRDSHLGTCDFSAMISPEAFERWVTPVLRWQMEDSDGRLYYHLDGPGELPHVERLLSLPDLRAIQWVPGAGNPGGLDEQWHPLYRRILDAGKKVCLSGTGSDPERLKAFFEKFPAERFFASFMVDDRRKAESLVAALRG